ncbi:MAG TPA: GMC family oxidoreductase, partial [Candidatus Hypogeohydataceae bacterium YC40]
PFLEQNELRDIWLSKEDGMFEFKLSSTGMHAVVSNGVGGGSLIYACVMMEPPDDVFETWPQPKLSNGKESTWPDVLKNNCNYYEKVRVELRAGNQTRGVVKAKFPNDTLLPKTELLKTAWEQAGNRGEWGVPGKDGERELPDLAHQPLDWMNHRKDVPSVEPEECISCANCVLGCRRKAKNTLDDNYIKRAIEKGTHLYPSHEVTAIYPLDEKGNITKENIKKYRVVCEGQHRVFEAPIVVLAAGTLGSTKLLWRCKNNPDLLPDLSDALGKNFSGNGDFQAGALVSPDLIPSYIENAPNSAPIVRYGPIITSSIDFHHFVIEDGGVPGAVADLMAFISGQMGEIGYLNQVSRNFDLNKFADFIRQLGSFSAEPKNTLQKAFMFLCAGRDGAKGRIEWKESSSREGSGDIDIIWDWENDTKSQELYKEMECELRHLVEEGMKGQYFAAPLWSLFGHLITIHPLGGCPMGTYPGLGSDSSCWGVVDSDGQVFKIEKDSKEAKYYTGLYVADGSIIPTALGVNPSLTIAALAERIAENIP